MKVEKFKILLHLKKKRLDKFGKSPIMGRIVLNNSVAEFSCKLSCTPMLWQPEVNRLKGKSREAVETNTKIEKLLLEAHSTLDTLMKRKKPFDAALLRDLLQGRMETQMTLLKLLDRHIEEMRKRVGIDYAPTSINTYVYTRRSLAEFIKKKFNTNDLAFGLLNERFIQEYQEFSLKDLGYAMQTVRHYLAILKKICKIAYKEGYVKRLYFLHFKLPMQKKSISKSLSRENFEKLKNLKISEKYSSHIFTKDLFLFACFTGTPYVDTMNITNDNLFTDDKGGLWLKYQRRKNGRLARVKLLPEAILLIEKYKDESRDTLFPMQRYDVLRANMKGLRIMADLTQDLYYHLGRHSFGTLMLSAGIPIESISKMMGHTNISSTQIYSKVTDDKISEDMDKLMERRKAINNKGSQPIEL